MHGTSSSKRRKLPKVKSEFMLLALSCQYKNSRTDGQVHRTELYSQAAPGRHPGSLFPSEWLPVELVCFAGRGRAGRLRVLCASYGQLASE